MTTHTVTNQPPPRCDLDELATNRPLVAAAEHHEAGWTSPTLHEVEYYPSYTRLSGELPAGTDHHPILSRQ